MPAFMIWFLWILGVILYLVTMILGIKYWDKLPEFFKFLVVCEVFILMCLFFSAGQWDLWF